MASELDASADSAPELPFGRWLRSVRESKGALQRSVAAAADMDSSHLGKVERGERLLTPEQATAIAEFLEIDPIDARLRLFAAKVVEQCGGDYSLAHEVSGLVQEQAAPYLVNKPANKVRAKK